MQIDLATAWEEVADLLRLEGLAGAHDELRADENAAQLAVCWEQAWRHGHFR